MPDITYGRWSPTEVMERVLDGTWVAATEELGGMVLIAPTSIVSTGTGNSSSIGANGSVTFSSCATLSLNGVFSATYENYMIAVGSTSSTATDMLFRLRASGSDNSTASSYVSQYLRANSTTVSGSRATASYTFTGATYNTQRAGCNINLFGPYLAQPTAMRSVTALDFSSAMIEDFAATHNQSTSYDGFSLYPSTGSFSGLISVYGLKGA